MKLVHVCVGLALLPAAGCSLPRSHSAATSERAPDERPLPRRVTVEVLNAGGMPGAARVTAQLLREHGLDVVFLDNARARGRASDTSVILVRRGDSTGAGRVVEVLGPTPIIDAPDSTRLVDLTVRLGTRASTKAPASRR